MIHPKHPASAAAAAVASLSLPLSLLSLFSLTRVLQYHIPCISDRRTFRRTREPSRPLPTAVRHGSKVRHFSPSLQVLPAFAPPNSTADCHLGPRQLDRTMNGMETYHGHVRAPADAIILFEACRIGLLPRVQRRLSEKERQSIKSGSVFVWDEREAGMRRWTDGKSWSASRVSGSFLTYREMEGKRGGSSFDKNANRDGMMGPENDSDGGPDGYRYKPDGLMKQSFSITTNQGQHLHLISYFSRSSTAANGLMAPSNDPQLRHIRPEKGMYPDSTVHEQSNIPAVTRGPMGYPGYTHSPTQYGRPYYAHPGWAPPSPMHTPPPPPAYSPYYHHPHGPYAHGMHYPPPPTSYGGPPAMTAFDRPPPPLSNSGLPPPPSAPYGQSHSSYGHSYPPPPATYHSAHSSYQPPPLQAPPYPSTPSYGQQSQQQAEPQTQQPTPAASDSAQIADSQHSSSSDLKSPSEPQASAGASPPVVSSGQTIPSISAMLNEGGPPPVRASSRSPGTAARAALHDIPTSKLGFEASRDMQTIRTLDKTTLKHNFS